MNALLYRYSPAMPSTTKGPWDGITVLFREALKRPAQKKIGIEIERLGLWPDGAPLLYRKHGERNGAEQLLNELQRNYSWAAVTNLQGEPLGFKTPYGKVSLEPGSQLELSADPVESITEMEKLVAEFEKKVESVTQPWGLRWLGIGVNPFSRVDQLDVIPAPRYHIMTDYLGRKDKLGTSMMRLTTSVQLNLDYATEADGIEMLRTALSLVPISYALFSNSPLSQGKLSGWQSYRGEIWRHTDADRTGLLSDVFKEGFDFESYAELSWNRPLMFAQNAQGMYVPAEGRSLAEIARGAVKDAAVDLLNEVNAVQQTFTEARLKPGYVEIRSIDGLRPPERYAAAAFWFGILYDEEARRLALELTNEENLGEREQAWQDTTRYGINTPRLGKLPIKDITRELLAAARLALSKRGLGEERYLEPLDENVAEGVTPADKIIQQFQGPWAGKAEPLVRYLGA